VGSSRAEPEPRPWTARGAVQAEPGESESARGGAPTRTGATLEKAEDMLTAWRILDAIYDNSLAFIKDLMQEIRAVPEFREEDCEKMMEYYMLLQSHIA
jgi:hypothetical protein